ncbi:MAG: hypothetical protein ACK559_02305, partial [bacterium]
HWTPPGDSSRSKTATDDVSTKTSSAFGTSTWDDVTTGVTSSAVATGSPADRAAPTRRSHSSRPSSRMPRRMRAILRAASLAPSSSTSLRQNAGKAPPSCATSLSATCRTACGFFASSSR